MFSSYGTIIQSNSSNFLRNPRRLLLVLSNSNLNINSNLRTAPFSSVAVSPLSPSCENVSCKLRNNRQDHLTQKQMQMQMQRRKFHSTSYSNVNSGGRGFRTSCSEFVRGSTLDQPGSVAFADCEVEAIADLFYQFAHSSEASSLYEHANPNLNIGGVDEKGDYLCVKGVRALLEHIGEQPDENMLRDLFMHNDGKLHFEEFLLAADKVLGEKPAGIVLVVGGPGSGKGLLCDRLAAECGAIHLSSGNLLRDEVASGTPLGKECADIMARGELVSSAVITALVRRRMRSSSKRRVLLDGFPRSLENAHDFVRLCGKPEVALHLECDDTVLMERIIKRAKQSSQDSGSVRMDDNIETALKRLRTYHKYHQPTIDWLREQGVPIVNLDCSGTPGSVWKQLVAIGRLMRPVVAYKNDVRKAKQDFSIFNSNDDHSTEDDNDDSAITTRTEGTSAAAV